MNDFSRSSDLLFSILFADDTSVFIEGTNFENISKILNTELEKVNMWLKANKLTINTKKTHYIMFHRTLIKHNTNIKIVINNNIVDHINNTKFLGVIIDSKLNWAAHILYIKTKISKSIGILLKIRKLLQKKHYEKYVFHFHLPIPLFIVSKFGEMPNIRT